MTNRAVALAAAAAITAACACPSARESGPADALIGRPVPAVPFYHLRLPIRLDEKGPFEINKVTVNGRAAPHFEVRDIEGALEEDRPYPFTWPLFAAEQIKAHVFRNPWLIVRIDWQNGETYDVEVEIGRQESRTPVTLRTQARAPNAGGYWDSRWKYYKSAVVSENFGLDRTDEPVEFSLVFYPDQVTELARELRVVHVDARGGATVLPSQVYEVRSHLAQDAERSGKDGLPRPPYWLPSVYAKVVTSVSLKANSAAVLLAFFGNPEAEHPEDPGTLNVGGQDLGLTISNESYSVKLHNDSGMLDEITLKAFPSMRFLHKLETNGAVHWNPDAYSPPRPWMHASDWDPPETHTLVRGPVMAALHRQGFMPGMPEIALGISYKFFARSPYFLMTSYMEILKDVPLQALRNAEIVLDHKLIDSAAWLEPSADEPRRIELGSVPLLTEIHLPLDARWMTFFHSESRTAFGGIPLESGQVGRNLEPLTYNPYFYITRGPWVYWTRVLVAPYLTHNIQQIIPVPAGNAYWGKWAYFPHVLGEGRQAFQPITDLEMRLSRPLRISVTDERDARVRVPDEIYTDPAKTG